MQTRFVSLAERFVRDVSGLRRTLSVSDFLIYARWSVRESPTIIKRRVLVPADSRMHGRIDVQYKKTRICVDLDTIDQLIAPDSATFSGIREMYCRDVYLKFFDFAKLDFRNVIDAGGNRGLFSIFAANLGANVAWVEPQHKYAKALASLIKDNHPRGRIHPLNGMVVASPGPSQRLGKGSPIADNDRGAIYNVEEIVAKCQMPSISFLKMDIEGAEFPVLLSSARWIDILDNLAMEVHPRSGEPSRLADFLVRNGFEVLASDANLQPSDPSHADYFYASRTGAIVRQFRSHTFSN